MKTFFEWTESLGWQPALLFLGALAITLCVVVLLISAAFDKYVAWRERCEIRERIWARSKECVANLIEAQRERQQREDEDAAFLRRLEIECSRDDIQRRREAKQFHIPAAFRDMKGTQR
jgi:hypothetical protein